jgi:hypothetical protein
MNNALFLFLILLLGLVLCSFLGGNCYREGLTNEDSSQPQTGVTGDASIQSSLYDNYNHFAGTSSVSTNGTTYYGPNGGVAKIITNADGTQSLQVTVNTNSSPVVFSSQPPTNPISMPPTSMMPTSMPPTSMMPTSMPPTSQRSNVFYGPNGNTATIVNTQQGTAIQVNTGNGTMTFTATMPNAMPETSSMSSTQYYGSTGTPVQSANYTLGYTQPNNAVTGPAGNTAYYAEGPAGNTVVDYSSSLPAGIPKRRIPAGEEDLYILKSQVVPPVCPICPNSSICPRDKPCPACPACARCPEPSMTCKAVPNYSAANYNNGMSNDSPFGGGGMINNQYIPVPVLNDFSTFGS